MAVRKRKKIGNKGGAKGTPLSKTAKARKGKHRRINQCHDFAWSRSLWKETATQIARVCFVLVVAYLICAISLAASDGLDAVDMIYFISATTTTIGLGDIAPSDQVNRAAAIILLPFGLVIISFGISVIIALAYARPFKPVEEEDEPKEIVYDKKRGYIKYFIEELQQKYDYFVGTLAYRLLTMFVKYVAVLLIGVIFISINDRERRLQKKLGEDMTIVDTAYFATILATTVGYGHRIAPQTDSLKLFLTFYMYLSTFVAGSIIGDISTLFVESKEDAIISIMVSSTTWVHKADLFQIGKICESDYVLFKLQQLQMVDDVVRRRLTNRFTELDFERRNRLLMIGRDVPSAEQVSKMKEATSGTKKSLIRAWSEMRCDLVADHLSQMSERGERASMIGCGGRFVSVSQDENDNEISQNQNMNEDEDGNLNNEEDDDEEEVKSDEGDKVALMKKKTLTTNGGAPGQEVKDAEEEEEEDDEKKDYFDANKVRLSKDNLSSSSFDHHPPPVQSPQRPGTGFFREISKNIFSNTGNRHLSPTFDQEVEDIVAKKDISYGEMLTQHIARPVRLSDCHDFAWSRQLWRSAAYDTFKLASVLTIIYTILGWYFLVKPEGMSVILGCYYLSATLSTVGFGDVAPTRQDTRFAAIFLIPFGLIIIGFLLSFVTAYTKSLPVQEDYEDVDPKVLERRALFETLDSDSDGILTRQEVINGCHLMSLSPDEAAELFDVMDCENKGELYPLPMKKTPWLRTARGKLTILFLKMFFTVLAGALFFKLYQPEVDQLHLTWIDAFYFATVTSTSVGYGDITPQTNGGRLFMIFYMLISTVIVGGVLSEVIDIYVNDYEGEKIIKTIINSTTWVHSADVANIGVITEADYVLFKLQQMQKVDAEMLDILIDRFEELDENANGWLDIGIDVPSAKQVKSMQLELKDPNHPGGKNIIALWKEKQARMESVLQARKEGDAIRHSRTYDNDDEENDKNTYLGKLNVEKEFYDMKKSREMMMVSPPPKRPTRSINEQKEKENEKRIQPRNSYEIFSDVFGAAEGLMSSMRDFTTRLGTSLDDVTVSTDPSTSSRSPSIENDRNSSSFNHSNSTNSNNNNNNSSNMNGSTSYSSNVPSDASQTSSLSTAPASSSTVGLYAARYDETTTHNADLNHNDPDSQSYSSRVTTDGSFSRQSSNAAIESAPPTLPPLTVLKEDSEIPPSSLPSSQFKILKDNKPSPKKKTPKVKSSSSSSTTPRTRSNSSSTTKKNQAEKVEMV